MFFPVTREWPSRPTPPPPTHTHKPKSSFTYVLLTFRILDSKGDEWRFWQYSIQINPNCNREQIKVHNKLGDPATVCIQLQVFPAHSLSCKSYRSDRCMQLRHSGCRLREPQLECGGKLLNFNLMKTCINRTLIKRGRKENWRSMLQEWGKLETWTQEEVHFRDKHTRGDIIKIDFKGIGYSNGRHAYKERYY
jgi:hypothetical protein